MTVYVDNTFTDVYGVARHDGRCRMMADTEQELMAMADRLAIPLAWIIRADVPFFRLTVEKRRRAVNAGATEVTSNELTAYTWHRQTYAETLKPWNALDKMREDMAARVRRVAHVPA